MNVKLCEFLGEGGWMLLESEHEERFVLSIRPKLVALHVPFMYETRAEYSARKRGHYERRLTLWRPLTHAELKLLKCL
jgi:hypothetical protein